MLTLLNLFNWITVLSESTCYVSDAVYLITIPLVIIGVIVLIYGLVVIIKDIFMD